MGRDFCLDDFQVLDSVMLNVIWKQNITNQGDSFYKVDTLGETKSNPSQCSES